MKGKNVNALSPRNHAETKLLVKACSVADRRRAVQIATDGQKKREAGRFAKSLDELSEAVEKYRKAGAQP